MIGRVSYIIGTQQDHLYTEEAHQGVHSVKSFGAGGVLLGTQTVLGAPSMSIPEKDTAVVHHAIEPNQQKERLKNSTNG